MHAWPAAGSRYLYLHCSIDALLVGVKRRSQQTGNSICLPAHPLPVGRVVRYSNCGDASADAWPLARRPAPCMHMQPRRPGPGPGSGSGARSAAPPPGPTARGDTAPAAGRMRVVHVTRSRGLHASLSNGRQKQRQAGKLDHQPLVRVHTYLTTATAKRARIHARVLRTVWFVSGNGGHAPAPRALIKGCLTAGVTVARRRSFFVDRSYRSAVRAVRRCLSLIILASIYRSTLYSTN